MATGDISRNAFDPKKHYSGVRMQQGRVITDDDWNDNERIEDEDRCRARVDIIGPAGSPDDGFKIKNPTMNNGKINFQVLPGSFYLGGLRLELEEMETFVTQKDWLQQPDNSNAPTAERFDMVYLEAWQQPVSAVEDRELFEAALGGPDTSIRIRFWKRVQIEPYINVDECEKAWQPLSSVDGCKKAWQTLKERWRDRKRGSLNPQNQLEPDVRLTVGFSNEGEQKDHCKPAVTAGYLGAENQAIRVQLTGTNHFTWGFDNASPLYRVKVAGSEVTMLTEPKDQAHWPLSEQVVEILPRSAVLPNREKLAEIQGKFFKVKTSYNPDEGKFTLTSALDPNFGKEGEEIPGYLFMRVWNRGSDKTSVPEIPFTPGGSAVVLGNTGLQVTFTGDDHVAGDYWIIAARPETPEKLVPWKLELEQVPPFGIRRFYAPLAIIKWTKSGDSFKVEVLWDCRKTFKPLTEPDRNTCCLYTVGDGKNSRGDFDSIKEALAHLPESGGDICLLPGFHETNTVIKNRQNVRIRGCEQKTIVVPKKRQDPIFMVEEDSQGITLESMDLVALGGTAITMPAAEYGLIREIEIKNNRIIALTHAVHVLRGKYINIHHNRIRMFDRENGSAAIEILAEDSIVERNEIGIVPKNEDLPKHKLLKTSLKTGQTIDPYDPCLQLETLFEIISQRTDYVSLLWNYGVDFSRNPRFKTPGAIQAAAGCERIKILENQITGGSGNGITLGSPPPEPTLPEEPENVEYLRGKISAKDLRGESIKISLERVTNKETKTITKQIVKDKYIYQFSFSDIPTGKYRLYVSYARGAKIKFKKPNDLEIDANFTILEEYWLTENEEYVIHIGAKEKEVSLAFIYDITIEDNEISHMGLSGIGVSWFDRSPGLTAAGTRDKSEKLPTAAVENLIIRQNHIFNCLQNPYNTYEADAQKIGLGGISLGMCEEVIIFGNRIENNGINHLYPACGIFISRGLFVDISHNLVVNNGPWSGGRFPVNPEPRTGIRGGIFLMQVSAPSKTVAIADGETLISHDKPAARVHGNVVDQPTGRALDIIARGPLSILDNQFNSELSDPGDGKFKVGTVKIKNCSSLSYRIAAAAIIKKVSPAPPSGDSATYAPTYPGISVNEMNIKKQMPKHNTLFNNNRTRMGPGNDSHISQFIISCDDTGFDGNQSDSSGTGNSISYSEPGSPTYSLYVLALNTMVSGKTLRVTGNRFQEDINADINSNPKIVSLSSLSKVMGNTTNNQGDHCIFALGNNVINKCNQVLNSSKCEAMYTLIENLSPSIINELLKEIYKVSGDIETEELSEALELEKDFYVTMAGFLEKEKERLETKYGTAHPRTRSIVPKLTYYSNMVGNFDAELQEKEEEISKEEEKKEEKTPEKIK